jgi:hypothetical protein
MLGLSVRLLCLLTALPLAAADFGFAVVIRAGDALLGGGRYEIGIGAAGSAPATTLSLTSNFLFSGGPRNFAFGYRNTTGAAFLRVYDSLGVNFQEVTYSPAGGGIPVPYRRWDLPGGAFLASAEPSLLPGAVTLDSLALYGAMTVIQPFSATTLTAANGGGGGSSGLGSGVRFYEPGTGAAGDWSVTGRITFSGLQMLFGGANRLRFDARIRRTASAAR